jgi:type IV secretion system protein VirD4
MGSSGVLFGQVLIVFAIIAVGLCCATQWTAAELGYQIRLGAPWFQMEAFPVYYPWRLFEWWYAYESYAPAIFNRGGVIVASSGLTAALTAIVGSILRARQSKRATTYGSARWANKREKRFAGLLRAAGVFLGRAAIK